MLYLIKGNLCGLVIYWWSSDLYSWPMKCDLCFRPASIHPNFPAMPEANELLMINNKIKINWLFFEYLVLKHHFCNLTFEVHHSLSSLLQALLYSTREKVKFFLLYCKDQIANEGQSLRFLVSSFNVHFFPMKRVIMLKEAKEKSLLPRPPSRAWQPCQWNWSQQDGVVSTLDFALITDLIWV